MALVIPFGLAVLTLSTAALAVADPAQAAARAASSIRQVDTSPSTSVVAVAPVAVSVTFSGAPDQDGVSLRILGPDGEVSSGQPQVVGTAIRRTLDENVPGGRFEVRWKARSTDGDKLSGSFEFIAARGNGTYASEPARPTGFPATTEAAVPVTPVPVTPAPVTPAASVSPAAVTAAEPGSGSGAGSGLGSGSLPAGWKLVPVALGAMLVLASAAVGMLGAGPALPWNRRQS